MDTIDSRNPTNLKTTINDSEKNVETNYVVQDHHLIKNTRAIVLYNYCIIPRENYIDCYYYHQVIYQLPKNKMTKFFQMKISLGKKLYITKSNRYK